MANICNICGANLEYKDGRFVCTSCGYIKEDEFSGEEAQLLLNASTELRLAHFDKAEELYSDFTRAYPKNSEGFFGLVLAKYGIKYEVDFDGTKKPTCYATSIESFLEDAAYKRAIALADEPKRAYYASQAEMIERVRVEWLERAGKEKPYDVFICFKDSDDENKFTRTEDYYFALEMYTHLVSKGYKTFFSPESLRGVVGEKYEPYIFNALSTAKVMIVYGSSPRYFESTWMRNEWTRFVKRMKSGEKAKGSLLVAFEGKKMEANELPNGLKLLQCLDASNRTFYLDLDDRIAAIVKAAKKSTENLPKIEREKISPSGKKVQSDGTTVEVRTREFGTYKVAPITQSEKTKYKIALSCLNLREFSQAAEEFKELLDKNPDNVKAKIGFLMASNKLADASEYSQNPFSLDEIEELSFSLERASGEEGAEAIKALQALSLQAVEGGKIQNAAALFKVIAEFKFEEKNSYIVTFSREVARAMDKKNQNEISRAVEVILYALSNEDVGVSVNLLKSFKQAAVSKNCGDVVNFCNFKSLDLNSEDSEALWQSLLMDLGVSDTNRLYTKIADFNHFDRLVKVIQYALKDKVVIGTVRGDLYYVGEVIKAVIRGVADGKEVEKKCAVFDKAICYIPAEFSDEAVKYLYMLADTLRGTGEFALAEKYYATVLGERANEIAAQWSMLLSKLHCKTEDEVVYSRIPLDQTVEFENVLALSSEQGKSIDRYIAVLARQKRTIKRIDELKTADDGKRSSRNTGLIVLAVCVFSALLALAIIMQAKEDSAVGFIVFGASVIVSAFIVHGVNISAANALPPKQKQLVLPSVSAADDEERELNNLHERVLRLESERNASRDRQKAFERKENGLRYLRRADEAEKAQLQKLYARLSEEQADKDMRVLVEGSQLLCRYEKASATKKQEFSKAKVNCKTDLWRMPSKTESLFFNKIANYAVKNESGDYFFFTGENILTLSKGEIKKCRYDDALFTVSYDTVKKTSLGANDEVAYRRWKYEKRDGSKDTKKDGNEPIYYVYVGKVIVSANERKTTVKFANLSSAQRFANFFESMKKTTVF